MAFVTGDNKSEYFIPIAPYSIAVSDVDNDGDFDLIFGHNYSWITQWSGISILYNNNGYFDQLDSIYLYGWQPDCQAKNLNQFPNSEIVGKFEDSALQDENIAIIYDLNITNINYFSLNTYEGVDNIAVGNIDYSNGLDILFSSYNVKNWGFMLNDGQGNLGSPSYFATSFCPTDIKSGKLNEDNFDDIVIGGADLVIKFSQGTSFQTLTFDEGAVDVEMVDLDNDGDMDIIGYDDLYFGTQVRFYENLGYNNFIKHEDWEFTPGCYIMTVSDFNNDSLPDLFFHANSDAGMYFYYNQGDFEFGSSVFFPFTNYGESSRRSASADFDNNGYNDLVIVRSSGTQLLVGNVTILFNDGNGNFQEYPITNIQTLNSKLKTSNLNCFPNPFKTTANIQINITENELTELIVYSLSGIKVKNLTNNKMKGGLNSIKWDGLDNGGKPCKPGTYLLTLKVNGNVLQTIKLIKY